MAKRATPRIVTEERNPYIVWVIVLVIIGGTIGVALFALDYLQGRALERQNEAAAMQAALQREVRRLEDEKAELVEQIAGLDRARQIDRQAQEELRKTLKSEQDESARLRKRLGFYETIVRPNDASPGLRVFQFDVNPMGGEGEALHRIRLILTQISKDYKNISGDVDFSVVGFAEGKERSLDLGECGSSTEGPIAFEFKYYQDITVDCLLPDDFTPVEVIVSVQQEGKKGKPSEHRFPWPNGKGPESKRPNSKG
ncbi:MAG: DUF6776 family protein [Gammaproteobacteria bacterium]